MNESSSPPRAGLALAGFIVITFCAPLFGAAAMPFEDLRGMSGPA